MKTLFLFVLTLNAYAATLPNEVKLYTDALMAYEKKPTGLEKVYHLGLSAAKVLETKIEAMEEKEFTKLQTTFKGFSLNRDESISVSPDKDFFKALAKKSQNKVDSIFFENLYATYANNGSIQDYYSLVTDVTACVDFEGKTLSDSFLRWESFQKTYPSDYKETATKELEDAKKALESDCICGSKESYLKQTSALMKAHPSSKLSTILKSQEPKIKKIRFNCAPT